MTTQWRDCSRGEFFRRAKKQYPFLSDANLQKLIDRDHITPIKPSGSSVFTEQCWMQLETFVLQRSRAYPKYMSRLDSRQGVQC